MIVAYTRTRAGTFCTIPIGFFRQASARLLIKQSEKKKETAATTIGHINLLPVKGEVKIPDTKRGADNPTPHKMTY